MSEGQPPDPKRWPLAFGAGLFIAGDIAAVCWLRFPSFVSDDWASIAPEFEALLINTQVCLAATWIGLSRTPSIIRAIATFGVIYGGTYAFYLDGELALAMVPWFSTEVGVVALGLIGAKAVAACWLSQSVRWTFPACPPQFRLKTLLSFVAGAATVFAIAADSFRRISDSSSGHPLEVVQWAVQTWVWPGVFTGVAACALLSSGPLRWRLVPMAATAAGCCGISYLSTGFVLGTPIVSFCVFMTAILGVVRYCGYRIEWRRNPTEQPSGTARIAVQSGDQDVSSTPLAEPQSLT